ncbi:MAG: hypothetical protein GJ680_00815 [Alteromonadaceae bacterium]|nr:hypothetical protein [Alteromonadaceae bacterium]
MIVDVYKIVTENSRGSNQEYSLSVEQNTCQSLVTDLSISWLARKGKMAALDKPNFQYCYTELAPQFVKRVVARYGFCVLDPEQEEKRLVS